MNSSFEEKVGRHANGASAGLLHHTLESLRDHLSYTLRPHFSEAVDAGVNLLKAETARLRGQAKPIAAQAKKTSILLGLVAAAAIFALQFFAVALVMVLLQKAPPGRQAEVLVTAGAIVLFATGILAMMLTHSIRRLGAHCSHFSDPGNRDLNTPPEQQETH